LAFHLLARISADYGMPTPGISKEALKSLKKYHFPGNVRELENILERAFALCDEGEIQAEDLQLSTSGETRTKISINIPSAADQDTEVSADPVENPPTDVDSLETYLEDIEKNVIVEALEATRWNKTAAAKKLGISFRALRYRLKKLELE
jgi:two-component system response regulator PilR (NtrC family)